MGIVVVRSDVMAMALAVGDVRGESFIVLHR